MQSVRQWLIRFVVVGAVFLVWLQPQGQAHAQTCYDASKNEIPCPKSDYQQKQDAAKLAGPSSTPVPDTATPTSTDTPVPPTNTPTATPTPTDTTTPAPQSAAAAVIPPAPPTDSASPKPPPLLWLGILAVGGLGVGSILLTQSRRRTNGDAKPGATPGAGGTGPAQMLIHKIWELAGSDGAPAPTVPERVDFRDAVGVAPQQRGAFNIDGVSSDGVSIMRETEDGPAMGVRGSTIDRDGKEHSVSPDAQNDFVKKYKLGPENPSPEADLSQADLDATQDKRDILAADLSQADLDASQDKRDILAGNDYLTDKTILTPVEQEFINSRARREGGDFRQKERVPGSPGTGGSIPGSGGGALSGHGTVVSSTPSTGSTGDGNDGKGDGKVSGKGEGKTGKGYGTSDGGSDDGGTDGGGKKETGDGKPTGGEKPKPTKGDSSTPGEGDGDGNAGGHGIFRPGQGFAGGTGPDPDLDHLGRPGGIGDMGGGPGQTGGRSTGEPDLDTHSGGDIGAAHPGMGGRLAPSEGVGTDTGDPVA